MDWLYKVFAMEIFHAANDICYKELGITINSLFGVQDFDNEVVHGINPRYGVLRPDGTYFTNYDYRKPLKVIQEVLARAYEARLKRYAKRIAILQQIILIYRQIVLLLGGKPVAVHEEELYN